MKECFVDKSFSETAEQLIKASNMILDEYRKQGYDLSLRQLFYQLVAHNVIPNRVEWYNKLGTVINDARLAGRIDWDMITDRGRVAAQAEQWMNPGNALRRAAKSFMFNKWHDQPIYIEVMVEKQALQGVLQPVCLGLGITFSANKGYSSASAFYQCSKRILKAIEKGKEPVVLYLGDHDPSGVDMTRDLRERMATFCRRPIDVKRLALNKSQVDEYALPPNPAKLSDSRAGEYVAKYGNESWELDALPPNKLANLVKAAVARRVDEAKWKASLEREHSMRVDMFAAAEVIRRKYDPDAVKPKITEVHDDDEL